MLDREPLLGSQRTRRCEWSAPLRRSRQWQHANDGQRPAFMAWRSLHYLKASPGPPATATLDEVIAQIEGNATDDPLFGQGEIRAGGRKIHDLYLFPRGEGTRRAEVRGNYYETLSTIPAAQASVPSRDGGCSLVQ